MLYRTDIRCYCNRIFYTVDSKYNAGEYEAAQGNAQKAKIFALIAIGLFALNLIYGIIMFITGGMDAVLEQYKEVLKYAE